MHHVTPDGETAPGAHPVPTEYQLGLLIGILVGEGHFGGDGRQPQLTLRMHTRHERLFRWLEKTFPGGRLYGPYHHGGRSYYQWMARGEYLRTVIAPAIAARLPAIDDHAATRFRAMCENYQVALPEYDPGASQTASI
jgi:hypothetical protein